MDAASIVVGRRQVLAHRVVAQQLDRTVDDVLRLAVLDLGLQDTGVDTTTLAATARTVEPLTPSSLDRPELVRTWATRGAPQVLRRADLPWLAGALWPVSDADARARIASSAIKQGAELGLAAFTATAEAMREVVTAPLPKGEVSGGVSSRVPASLTFWCRTCGSQHVSGGIFQQVGLAAGVELLREGPRTVVAPLEMQHPIPVAAEGTSDLLARYLHLMGPAGPAEAAAYLGTTRTASLDVWPDDVVEVVVDGRPAWLPESSVDSLCRAPDPRLTRLLPPADPWLQARDRDLLLPDKAQQKVLWRVISSPGALLVDGEIVGTWKSRRGRKGTLQVSVTPFAPLTSTVSQEVEDEAARVATARGAEQLDLVVE